MKKLVIAEKPSVARDIAKVLGCNDKGNGYLYNDKFIISWAVGHLVTLCEPEEYNKIYKKWSMETLPIIPEKIKTKTIKNTKSQFDILKGLMDLEEVTSLICATDSGREGELIFRYIYELANCKKPFERLWISSMTNKAISDGFNNLKDGSEYDNLYTSAKCRSEADWLVGINASRAFSIKYNALLSIGRVQTPTLALIVEKKKEIDSFVVTEYFEVEADFEKYKGTWINDKEESKIKTKEEADIIAEKVKGKEARVLSVENEEKKILPPLLFDLTELQRECNRKFGFSAKKTLDIAQALYESRKMITYPRTDSRHLSDDMIPKLKIVLTKLFNTNDYKPYAEKLLTLENLPITKRIVDNTKISDHHAIIPTEVNINLSRLTSDEFKVYDLIARRFMQVFYPPYVYSATKIITLCENDKFITRGTTVINKGWQELNIVSEKEKKKKDEPLPALNKDDIFTTKTSKVILKKTKPPTPYNEAGLLSAMENAGRFVDDENLKEQLKESGLGTPATRAAIIERLLKVGYIKREKKYLVPTEKGIKLIEIVPPELKSPETTGKWEKGLTSISKGKMQREKFMNSIKRYVSYLVEQSKIGECKVLFAADKKRGKIKANILGTCPNCGGNILENSKGYYCTNWRQGCKFTIWKNSLSNYSLEVTPDIVKSLLETGEAKNMPIMYMGLHSRADIILSKDNLGRLEVANIKTNEAN
ncbi:MAG: DNA topoisomerase III [Lachnospirales bacterium]